MMFAYHYWSSLCTQVRSSYSIAYLEYILWLDWNRNHGS